MESFSALCVYENYDNNGNLKQNNKYNFSYDYKNRLVKVTNLENKIISEYLYDVLGRRYEKKTNTETMSYIYSDKNIISEYKTAGAQTYKKDYVNGLGIDNILAVEQEEQNLTQAEREELNFCENTVLTQSGNFVKYGWNAVVDRCNTLQGSGSEIVTNRYYFHKNHLGSVVGITDNSGSLVTSYEYDSYGNFVLSGSDIGNSILFTGREYDQEIGWYYYRARYYDAELGRFISRDPIGQVDDVNLYGYVGNNPVMGVDPSGLEKTLIFWGEDYLSYERYRSGGNDNFQLKAEVYKEHLIELGYNSNNIIITNGTTFENWQYYLKNSGKIGKIIYFGHGSNSELFLSDGTPDDLSDNKESGLRTIYGINDMILETFNDGTSDHYLNELYNENALGATISLFSCNSANNPYGVVENSSWQTISHGFSEYFQGNAVGATSNVNFTGGGLFGIDFIPEVQNGGEWKAYLYDN